MKRTTAQLKQMARTSLNGKYGVPMGATVLIGFINSILFMLSFALFTGSSTNTMIMSQLFTIVIALLISVFSAGLIKLYLSFCRKEEYTISTIFFAFSHHPDRIIIASFFLVILSFFAEIPLLIGAFTVFFNEPTLTTVLTLIVLSCISLVLLCMIQLRFALVMYLLIDHTDMGAIEAIKQSSRLMKGNMGRLFYLSLSFLGFILLSICTCYIAFLWVLPYMSATNAYFYLDLIGELDTPKVEIEEEEDADSFRSSYTV